MAGREREQFEEAKWILERNLHWIAAAEVKVGVLVAIDAGMLGALSAMLGASTPADRPAWAWVAILPAFGALIGSVWSVGHVLLPRVSGPTSLIFFGSIAKCEVNDYIDQFTKRDAAASLRDCLLQVHRNAEIARDKFAWVRAAMIWAFLALPLWVASLAALVRQ
jgi:hypothetical protein